MQYLILPNAAHAAHPGDHAGDHAAEHADTAHQAITTGGGLFGHFGHNLGVWMHGLNLWDIAAGCLLIQEAGGLIGDFEGGLDHLASGNLVAANPKMFKTLGSLARQHLAK